MTVKEYLKKTIGKSDTDFQLIRPRAICKDGYSISIQASHCHYCDPREDFLEEYDSVELGYPNQYDELIDEYAEDFDDDGKACTNTVFGFVPMEIVEKLVKKHGGIID